ncbi:hypothetical protein AAFF_G00243480 [Aldrovandia affinis]|uniref:Uncharacterized protein n=1 Tax=Aldrovandia affinis TaxID=143900 RepID=A0AAD7QZR5_9TELE|nr:hypothetical protein AAFF_G00243480 [Aldrovandia affinis]
MQRLERMPYPNWKDTCGPYSNIKTNDRGLRLLEFARYNSLDAGEHTWPPQGFQTMDLAQPNGEHHNQIDYILIKKRFQSALTSEDTQLPKSRHWKRP